MIEGTAEEIITVKMQKYICKEYCTHCRASFHKNERDIDFGKGMHSIPDGLAICCAEVGNSILKQIHAIEAKSYNTRNELWAEGNILPSAYVQAREYYGNYNWLIIETEAWDFLTETQQGRLISLCEKRVNADTRGVGLAIISSTKKTKIKILVEPVRNNGDFLEKYPLLSDRINCE